MTLSSPAPGVRLALRCPCGVELVEADAPSLIATVNAHLDELHPRVAGSYDDDDILALAYQKPA